MDLLPPPLELHNSVSYSYAPAATSTAALLDLAVVALRHAPFLVFIVLHLSAAGVAAESDDGPTHSATPSSDGDQCSKALGFNESISPQDRSAQDLHFCHEHHKRTCCEKNKTREVLGLYAAFSYEKSDRCTQMSKLALCSICDGDVGIGLKAEHNLPRLCPSLCKRWFQACFGDFFAPTGSGELVPCTPNSLVCSPANEITDTSAEFCAKVGGFAVAISEDASQDDAEDSCYDGIPAARTRGKAPRAAWTKPKTRFSTDAYPWWHPRRWQLYFKSFNIQAPQTPRWMQQNAPAIIVASVAVIFSAYVFLRVD